MYIYGRDIISSLVCTMKKTIENFKLKVDVQKEPLRFRGKMAIDVQASSNLVHPNDVFLGSDYYELYPMDEKRFNDFLVGK